MRGFDLLVACSWGLLVIAEGVFVVFVLSVTLCSGSKLGELIWEKACLNVLEVPSNQGI